MKEVPLWGGRYHGQRVRPACRQNRRPFQRIHGQIELGTRPCPYLFANVEHGRFIAFPFPDHDRTVDLDRSKNPAHRFSGRLVRGPFVAPAHQPCTRQRRGLGHADEFHRQVTVHVPLQVNPFVRLEIPQAITIEQAKEERWTRWVPYGRGFGRGLAELDRMLIASGHSRIPECKRHSAGGMSFERKGRCMVRGR